MANHKIAMGFCFTLLFYLLLIGYRQVVSAAPSQSNIAEHNQYNINHRFKMRPASYIKLVPRPLNSYAKLKSELGELLVDDDDFFELNKRQSDDYGHLRFGKRDEFDDYGHMRFGRSGGSTSDQSQS